MTTKADWLDGDGYPTEAALEKLKSWAPNDLTGALDFMKELWSYPEAVRSTLSDAEQQIIHPAKGNIHYHFATGGWSGNESLVHAFRENRLGWVITFCLHARGGRYIFRYPKPKEQKSNEIQQEC